MTAMVQESCLALPPERFYWALLDTSKLGVGFEHRSRRAQQRQLGYLFENDLPIPVDCVHSTYLETDRSEAGARLYLACAMSLDQMQESLAVHGQQALMLFPLTVPDFIREKVQGQVDLHGLNLLHGQFEPPILRALQRRSWIHLAVMALACGLIVTFGFERRTAHLHRQMADVNAVQSNIYKDVFGSVASAGSRQPIELSLIAELRKVRQTRRPADADLPNEDSLPAFAGMLSRWPGEIFLQTDSISLTSSALTIRGSVPASADVQKLVDALQGLSNWRVQPPQVSATPQGIQTAIQMVRLSDGQP